MKVGRIASLVMDSTLTSTGWQLPGMVGREDTCRTAEAAACRIRKGRLSWGCRRDLRRLVLERLEAEIRVLEMKVDEESGGEVGSCGVDKEVSWSWRTLAPHQQDVRMAYQG